MRALTVLILILICELPSAAVLAQTQPQAPGPSATQPQTGSLEGILKIEEPLTRIEALQKFLKSNIIPEQTQSAREALVASYAQVGETELGENRIERAAEEFRRAIAGLPETITDRFFEEVVIRIPLAVSIRGYRNEATELARSLESRFAKQSSCLARIGEFYLTIEAPGDAIRALEASSALADDKAGLHRALGAAYRMGLRLDDAISEYQQAIRADPKDKRAYYEMANLYRAFGAYPDAIKLYQKQIEIESKHTPSFKGMALALLSLGKEDEAAAALNQARDIRGAAEEITGDIYLQTQLAFHYLSQKKMKQARQAADLALYVEPRYAWARIAAAEIDMAEGKYFDAERNLLAAKAYAGFPTLFFTLGKVYLAVEDFDGAQEQFSQAFTYSSQKQFTTRLGGTFDAQADTIKELLAREHQASIFLHEPPTTEEQFKIAESLVKFNTRLRMLKIPPIVNRPQRKDSKSAPSETNPNDRTNNPEARRKQMEDLDQAAMGFIEAENVRRAYRMLYIAQRLAYAGVATGLAIELADQALGMADIATEYDGSFREYPNYDRNGRLGIFRGRALDAKGWALFKTNRYEEALAVLSQAVRAYGTLPEGRGAVLHLAAINETVGELQTALDLYISAYEQTPDSSIDVNRIVIEALYRKVHGSLDGLEKRIGPEPIAVSTSFAQSSTTPLDAKPARSTLRKEAQKKPSLPALPPAEVFNKEVISPVAARSISTPAAVTPSENKPPVLTLPPDPKSVASPTEIIAITSAIRAISPVLYNPDELSSMIPEPASRTVAGPVAPLLAERNVIATPTEITKITRAVRRIPPVFNDPSDLPAIIPTPGASITVAGSVAPLPAELNIIATPTEITKITRAVRRIPPVFKDPRDLPALISTPSASIPVAEPVVALPAELNPVTTPTEIFTITVAVRAVQPVFNQTVELPAIIPTPGPSLTLVSPIGRYTFYSPFDWYLIRTRIERDAAELFPGPPAPKVYTRKRRVTVSGDPLPN